MRMNLKRQPGLMVGAVCLFALLLVSCQPAPEQAAVQVKDQGEMLKVIQATPAPAGQAMDFPEEAQLSLQLSNQVKVEVAATVDSDREGGYPVYAIVPHRWTQEEAESMLQAMIGDRPLWAASWGNSVRTKDSMDVAILSLKQQLANATSAEERQQIQSNLQLYEGLYAIAQDTRYEIPAEPTFSNVLGRQLLQSFDNEWAIRGTIDGEKATQEEYESQREQMAAGVDAGESESIEGIVELGAGKEGFIRITRTRTGKNDRLQYNRYDVEQSILETYGLPYEKKSPVTISLENAREMAQQTVQDLGIDYMVELETEQIDAVPEYYLFTFVRAIDDVPMELVSPKDATGINYREAWKPESITVCVDNQGVWYVGWDSPSDLKEELNANVALLSFERILEVFQTQAQNQFVYSEHDAEYLTQCAYEIDRVALNYMAVAKEGTQDEYLLIPVWDFYGRTVLTYSDAYYASDGQYDLDDNNQRVIQNPNYSYMTINALDGTIIDRDLGY